ncbi:hypothetical protein EVAR_92031_1 [Eumeta japonica]|uniref:Uncharacterized protein n=1 Tax=Eumeta variegata TaxID=151549 RepID=A0A4C2AA61_EUMVA|nr:hypothetical protein EVAR_92031_1 [Eumeta japonica]
MQYDGCHGALHPRSGSKAGYEADKYKEGAQNNTISNFRHERDREHPLFEIHRCRVNFDETRKPTSIGVGVENALQSHDRKSMVLYDQRFPFWFCNVLEKKHPSNLLRSSASITGWASHQKSSTIDAEHVSDKDKRH